MLEQYSKRLKFVCTAQYIENLDCSHYAKVISQLDFQHNRRTFLTREARSNPDVAVRIGKLNDWNIMKRRNQMKRRNHSIYIS